MLFTRVTSRAVCCIGLLGLVSPIATAAWDADDFDGAAIDPVKWSVVNVDHGRNNGTVQLTGTGSLQTVIYQRENEPLDEVCVESIGDEIDVPWTYYARVAFTPTAGGWTTVFEGFTFVMADGSTAFVRFDSQGFSRCTLKYGSVNVATGPTLWRSTWYDFKFSWDGTVLRAWYKEVGRESWIGNYAVFSSSTTYPQKLRIGQGLVTGNTGSSGDVNMELYVDFFSADAPAVLPECFWEDDFDYTWIDPSKWSEHLRQGFNTGSIALDGYGSLTLGLYSYESSDMATGVWAEGVCRIPNQPWEYYSKARFHSTPQSGWGRTDVDLGFNFEMADGTNFAFVQFDNNKATQSYPVGCHMKYGTATGTNINGPELLSDYWYEWKFAWTSGGVLKAWYREPGRERWLPSSGYSVFGSSQTHPELVRIGHRDLVAPTSSADVQLYLDVDYWRQTGEPLREVGPTSDSFEYPDIDLGRWLVRDWEGGYNPGIIYPDGLGSLYVEVGSYEGGYLLPQKWVEPIRRLGDTPWTCYTGSEFTTSSGLGRSDVCIGYRFIMTDGTDAWLEYDSYDTGCRLKYGNTAQGNVDAASLWQSWPMEFKFAWDGSALRAWYRERGNQMWLGGLDNAGLILFGSATEWPEVVRIGQTQLRRPVNSADMIAYCWIDHWTPDTPLPPDAMVPGLTDEFTLTSIDPALWSAYDADWTYNTGSVTDPGGYLRVQMASYEGGYPRPLEWIAMARRLAPYSWTCQSSARFSCSATGRSDVDMGYHFMLSDGRIASLVFDAVSGMRVKTGLNTSASGWSLSAGPTLTPGTWYQWKFDWDGSCLTASYRLSEADPWEGPILLFCDGSAYPERIRVGQINWRYPSDSADWSAQMDVDYLRLQYSPCPADYDHDGDVDADDYDVFESCGSGPGIPCAGDCGKANFDNDGDVDQSDFAIFQRCYSGENVPADPNCAN